MSKKRVKLLIRLFLILIISSFVFTIICVAVIKFDTPLAAEFTDKYLRPTFGNDFVVSIERIFYNISDKITQLTYKPDGGFMFLYPDNYGHVAGSNLDLTTISTHYFALQKDEGVWKNYKLSIFPDKEVMAYTFVRPDSSRPFAYVTLVQMDMKALNLSAVPGTQQPAGVIGIPGPGKIPSYVVTSNNLVAAFNGGFQYRDGQYGMVVGGKTYLPLKNDLATLIDYSNGNIKIIKYEGSIPKGRVDFIRQNCPMLIENGEIATYSDANRKLWGRTPTTSIYTWRSGLGLLPNGNLVYAVGNNLIPDTLANALKMVGATSAMQLDINPYWVRFNIFDTKGNGTYNTSTLMKGVYNGSSAFLNGYQKDFFYVYKR